MARRFDAYNTCNIAQFSRSLSSDLEFFHDTTGLKGHDWNIEALKSRCAEQTKYHRSLDEESVQATGPWSSELTASTRSTPMAPSSSTLLLGLPMSGNRHRMDGNLLECLAMGIDEDALHRLCLRRVGT